MNKENKNPSRPWSEDERLIAMYVGGMLLAGLGALIYEIAKMVLIR
jgi:hypothetical protein